MISCCIASIFLLTAALNTSKFRNTCGEKQATCHFQYNDLLECRFIYWLQEGGMRIEQQEIEIKHPSYKYECFASCVSDNKTCILRPDAVQCVEGSSKLNLIF